MHLLGTVIPRYAFESGLARVRIDGKSLENHVLEARFEHFGCRLASRVGSSSTVWPETVYSLRLPLKNSCRSPNCLRFQASCWDSASSFQNAGDSSRRTRLSRSDSRSGGGHFAGDCHDRAIGWRGWRSELRARSCRARRAKCSSTV